MDPLDLCSERTEVRFGTFVKNTTSDAANKIQAQCFEESGFGQKPGA